MTKKLIKKTVKIIRTENLPNWDLSDLYEGMASKKLKDDLKKAKDLAQKFNQKYQNKIAALDAKNLAQAIKNYEEIGEILGRLMSFAYLGYAANLADPNNTTFYQNISENINKITTNLLFFELEINKLDEKKLASLIKESALLAKYQPYLRDVRFFKKYQLSEELEKLMLEKSSSGRQAWSRLFDEIINNLEFPYKNKKLNNAQIFDLLSNKDEKIRKSAAKIIGAVLKNNIKTLAYITNILAKDKEIDDGWRGFTTPISSRNLSNFVEDEIIENLSLAVKKNYPKISHRYYKIKAKILGKKKLNYWDRNAPLSNFEDKRISWIEAKEIVLCAYNSFSPKLAALGQKFFDNNWIDVGPRQGKESGAFSHPTIPSAHPYILLNYQGKLRDVMTLAHELGHGVHQLLAGKQGNLMAGTPLTLAETASVFGEQLAFQEILKREKNSEKKKLIIASKIEDMINTAVRQIAFLEFERKVHNERRKGEIAIEKLNQFWIEVQKESLGNIFEFDGDDQYSRSLCQPAFGEELEGESSASTANVLNIHADASTKIRPNNYRQKLGLGKRPNEYQYYWSYIPHFIHSPFYVYSYAFGDCLVNSLYGQYKKHPDGFVEKYFAMLEAGGTLHHKELLAPFGLDASHHDFWQKGLDVIISYIDMIDQKQN